MALMRALLVIGLAVGAAGAADKKGDAKSPVVQAASIREGQPAPDFTLMDQNDKPVKLSSLRGKWVVLYFYPKDDTPGCTVQACDFTDRIKDFEGLNATVLGCSSDSTESHRAFIKKKDLKITLLSDPTRQVMSQYGGSIAGKTVRSTVVIDPKGVVHKHYTPVKPQGHADELKKLLADAHKK
jgi:peroxiredoxin Q/BCP